MKKITFIASFVLASLFSSCGDGSSISTRYVVTGQNFRDGAKSIAMDLIDDKKVEIDPRGASGTVVVGDDDSETVTRSVTFVFTNPEGEEYELQADCTYTFFGGTMETTQDAELSGTIVSESDIIALAELYDVTYDESMSSLSIVASFTFADKSGTIYVISESGTGTFINKMGSLRINLNS